MPQLRSSAAWWAAVYGVAQSRTRLMWLRSSSQINKFFFILFIYFWLCQVFIAAQVFPSSFGEQELLSNCGAWTSHHGGFSRCGARTLGTWVSVVAIPRLSSVTHGLSCSEAREIFPDQGRNSCLLHCQVDSLLLSHQGNPVNKYFLKKNLMSFFLKGETPVTSSLFCIE